MAIQQVGMKKHVKIARRALGLGLVLLIWLSACGGAAGHRRE